MRVLAIGGLAAASVLSVAATASAQTVVNPQAVATTMQTQNVAVVQEQAAGNVLRAGAPVPVALSEFLTTKGKHLKVGQRVQLEVAAHTRTAFFDTDPTGSTCSTDVSPFRRAALLMAS